MMNSFARDRRSFAPEDGAGAGGDDAAATAAAASAAATAADAAAAGQTTPAAKWWDAKDYSAEDKTWLAARGMAEDDPNAALVKAIKGHRSAEQRIGKGLDSIIDKPGKDQPYSEWVAANRAALGLPADEASYKIAPPEGWPKDLPWDTAGEGKARSIALKYGLPEAALQELVALQAGSVMELNASGAAMSETAKRELMADLEKDFGTQTPALITKAKQAAQLVAEKAGLSTEALANLSDVMMDKIGDANVIRFMGSIADMMSDDAAVGLGKGGSMTTTPAEARQQIAQLRSADGEYAKAVKSDNRAEIARLQPQIDRLTKIAAGG